ncbi:unnamed protein product [Prorocentrum cordatum]|uniref:CCHC-type domain-containing protein n=1 Tax=Prorocentrum cordatum TaxID=2364126 RepID=A0ABN9Y4F9_9DINO|nr:unnamed protein product [Polarella glacialis]
MADAPPAATVPDGTFRRGSIQKHSQGHADADPPGGRGDRSRTPLPINESALDSFATVAYVQSLKDKLDSMEAAIRDTINASVSSAMGTATGPISAALAAAQAGTNGLSGKIEQEEGLAVGQQIDASRKSFQQQVDALTQRMGDIESRQDQADKAISQMSEQIAALQKALEVANKQPAQETLVGRDFDRDVDLTIVKVHADGLVTLDKAIEALTKWISDCGIEESRFKVQGHDTSVYFTIQFTGLPGPASRRVQKSFDSLRNRDGSWPRIRAPAIAGNGSVDLRVGPDRSPKQIKTEIVGKRIRRALERAFPTHTRRVDCAKGWISANWSPVLSYIFDVMKLRRLPTRTLPTLGITRAQIKDAIDDVVTPEMVLGAQEARQNRAQLLAFARKVSTELSMHSSLAPLLIFYNIHNYEIGNAAAMRTSTKINGDMHLARDNRSKIAPVVIGDFNFAAVGKLKPTEPSARASSDATETSKASARQWHGALKHLLEFEGSDAIHFCAETLVESTIDRCFCSITPSQMIQLAVASAAFSTPELLSCRRFSDHAAVLVSFAMRDLEDEKNQPIAQCIFKPLIFMQIAERAFSQTDLDKLPPPARLLQSTELPREVARAARDRTHEGNPGQGAVQLQRAKSIARAVWRQDCKLAVRPLRAHAKAQDILDISMDQIKLTDPASFEERASAIFRQDADQRRAAVDLARQRGRLPHAEARAQSQPLRRKSQLWNPIIKRLVLTGAKTITGTVTGPTERLQKLMEHWQPVFQGKTVDAGAAGIYFSRCAPKIDFNSYAPPDYDTLRRFARRSSPAPPGVQHHGRCDGRGGRPCGTSIAAWLHHRRNFGYDIRELDVESRVASADSDARSKLPVLVSLDIALAFPSFAHQFIRLALKAMGAPVAALNFFDSMWIASCAGLYVPLFYIRSGIVQGCGWSGILYAMGAACVVRDLEQQLELKGVMALMENLTGLALKPAKCRIIPLAGPVDDGLVSKLRDALVAIAPRFQEFNICDNLTYVGLLLGPGATEGLIYAKAFQKFRWRTKMHTASGAPSVGPAQLFKSRALPVLSYLAQCAPLPHESFKVENWVNASVLRSPSGAFRVKDWPGLQDRGARSPRPMQLATIAAIVRAATPTFHKFPESRKRLRKGLRQHGDDQTLPGVARAALHLSPPWWKTLPFVEAFRVIVPAETDHRYYPSALLAPALAAARAPLAAGKHARVQRMAHAAARSALGADEIGTFLAKMLMIELPDLVNTFENDSEVFDRVKIAMTKLPLSWDVANLALLDTSLENIERVVIACGTYHVLRLENSVDAETLRSAARIESEFLSSLLLHIKLFELDISAYWNSPEDQLLEVDLQIVMANEQQSGIKIPVWNGEASTLESFEEKVKLWVLGTKKDDRIYLGPRLVQAMDEDSQQWFEAKKVSLDDLVKEDGAEKVVEALKGVRGTVTMQEAVSKWREFMRGVCRHPGEGPKRWVSRFDIHLSKIGKALHAVCDDIPAQGFMHEFILGLILLDGTGLDPSEQAAVLATSGPKGNSYLYQDVKKALAEQWSEEQLASRDEQKGYKARKGAHAVFDDADELAAYAEEVYDEAHIDGFEEAADITESAMTAAEDLMTAALGEEPIGDEEQGEDALAAAASTHETNEWTETAFAASRTFVEARKLINEVKNARGYFPVVGLGAYDALPTQPAAGAGRGRAVSRGGPPRKGKGKDRGGVAGRGKGRGQSQKRPAALPKDSNSGTNDKFKGACLLCGEPGHKARDCPNRGNGGAQGERRRAFNSFVGAADGYSKKVEFEDVQDVFIGTVNDEGESKDGDEEGLDEFVAFSMDDCKGYALLDGGASRSVGGVEQLEYVNERLSEPMEVSPDKSLGFSFAGGDRADAPSRVTFNVKVLNDEAVSIYVLDRQSPVLLGIDMLKKYGLVIDYFHNTVYSHRFKREIPTRVLPSGHLALNLTALGNEASSAGSE